MFFIFLYRILSFEIHAFFLQVNLLNGLKWVINDDEKQVRLQCALLLGMCHWMIATY